MYAGANAANRRLPNPPLQQFWYLQDHDYKQRGGGQTGTDSALTCAQHGMPRCDQGAAALGRKVPNTVLCMLVIVEDAAGRRYTHACFRLASMSIVGLQFNSLHYLKRTKPQPKRSLRTDLKTSRDFELAWSESILSSAFHVPSKASIPNTFRGSPAACFLPRHNMPFNDLDYEELTKTLTDNFNILADEVQLLSDRKTILEHKLRFAHEQVS
jgi:hypothetical protein